MWRPGRTGTSPSPVWEIALLVVLVSSLSCVLGADTPDPTTPASAETGKEKAELLVPGTHADQAALTAHFAFLHHKWAVKKFGEKHPKTELTRAIALFQQHYANALAVIGITYPYGPIDVVWLRKHIQLKINQLNAHIDHISPALSKAISVSVPVWFQNSPNIYTRSRAWVNVSPRLFSISPCLLSWGATGVNIGPTLINIQPRLININARGVDVGPALVDIKSRGIDVGPVGIGWDQPTYFVSIAPRWINVSPTLRLVDVDHWWPNPIVGPNFPKKGPFPITSKTTTVFVQKFKQVPAPPTSASAPSPKPAPRPTAPAPAPGAPGQAAAVSVPATQGAASAPMVAPMQSQAAASAPVVAPMEALGLPPQVAFAPAPAAAASTEAALVAPILPQPLPVPQPAPVVLRAAPSPPEAAPSLPVEPQGANTAAEETTSAPLTLPPIPTPAAPAPTAAAAAPLTPLPEIVHESGAAISEPIVVATAPSVAPAVAQVAEEGRPALQTAVDVAPAVAQVAEEGRQAMQTAVFP